MSELLRHLRENIWLVVAISAAGLVISLVSTGTILLTLPADHFQKSESSGLRRLPGEGGGGPFKILGRIGKNLLGLVLVLVGVILSLPGVPGPGLLTILSGLLLVDFPGKQGIERKIISRPGVLGPINRLRARFGRPSFEL